MPSMRSMLPMAYRAIQALLVPKVSLVPQEQREWALLDLPGLLDPRAWAYGVLPVPLALQVQMA